MLRHSRADLSRKICGIDKNYLSYQFNLLKMDSQLRGNDGLLLTQISLENRHHQESKAQAVHLIWQGKTDSEYGDFQAKSFGL